MRVLLLGALGLPCEAMSSASIRDGGYGSFTAFAIYMTVICLVAGVSFFLGTQVGLMKDDYRRIMVNQNLRKVLKLLKRVKATMTGIQEAEESAFLAEESEEEILEETESEIKARYKSSEMCEVSDSELWMHYNHGEASPSPGPSEEDPMTMKLHCIALWWRLMVCSLLGSADCFQSGTKQKPETMWWPWGRLRTSWWKFVACATTISGDAIIACDMQKDMNVFGTTQSTLR